MPIIDWHKKNKNKKKAKQTNNHCQVLCAIYTLDETNYD